MPICALSQARAAPVAVARSCSGRAPSRAAVPPGALASRRPRCSRARASAGDFFSFDEEDNQQHPPTQDARPLFTLDRASAGDNLTFEDIRDAYEMCSTIPDAHERGQCYSVFNIDGERMASYYPAVARLEETLVLGGVRGELERRAAAAQRAWGEHVQQQQQQWQQHQQHQQHKGADSSSSSTSSSSNPLTAFFARLFSPPSDRRP